MKSPSERLADKILTEKEEAAKDQLRHAWAGGSSGPSRSPSRIAERLRSEGEAKDALRNAREPKPEKPVTPSQGLASRLSFAPAHERLDSIRKPEPKPGDKDRIKL